MSTAKSGKRKYTSLKGRRVMGSKGSYSRTYGESGGTAYGQQLRCFTENVTRDHPPPLCTCTWVWMSDGSFHLKFRNRLCPVGQMH